jgi:hypothetical protein
MLISNYLQLQTHKLNVLLTVNRNLAVQQDQHDALFAFNVMRLTV